jgi:hypothetical protein
MLEKVIHKISEFYLKNVQNPRMIADQRISDILLDCFVFYLLKIYEKAMLKG